VQRGHSPTSILQAFFTTVVVVAEVVVAPGKQPLGHPHSAQSWRSGP
jgi:hypothetical protein